MTRLLTADGRAARARVSLVYWQYFHAGDRTPTVMATVQEINNCSLNRGACIICPPVSFTEDRAMLHVWCIYTGQATVSGLLPDYQLAQKGIPCDWSQWRLIGPCTSRGHISLSADTSLHIHTRKRSITNRNVTLHLRRRYF
jgi:hypothetical protein